jgi:competence ComEA-like helix-hairpin-helix protein
VRRTSHFGFWILDCLRSRSQSKIQNPKSKIQNRHGSALISAIFVLVVIVGLVAALAPLVRVDVRAAGRRGDHLRALYLAKAGVNLALVALQQDETPADGPEDDWALLGERGQIEYPLGEGLFRLEVVDASSRLDLNRIDRETLLRLPGIDETTVDEILAWRGQGSDQNPAGGQLGSAGVASGNYEGLPRPYRLKAAPFDSVEELLLVQGVTPSLLYGLQEGVEGTVPAPWIDLLSVDTWSPNQDADGGARIELNAATVEQLVSGSGGALNQQQAQAIVDRRGANGRFTSLADLLSVTGVGEQAVRSLVDHVTLTPGDRLMGRLNVNTASLAALETLPDVTEEMAQQIVERRETEGEFETLGDLLDLGQETFRALVDHATTKSSVFLVRAWGEARSNARDPNAGAQGVEAWVLRENDRARVIRWREVGRSPGWEAWRWGEDQEAVGDLQSGMNGQQSVGSGPR